MMTSCAVSHTPVKVRGLAPLNQTRRRGSTASCGKKQATVYCAQGQNSEERGSRTARVAFVGAVAAGIITGVPADASQASEAYDLCTSDFCRERVLRQEERRGIPRDVTVSAAVETADEAVEEAEAGVSLAQKRALERKAALEQAAADRAAAAQLAAERAAEQRAKVETARVQAAAEQQQIKQAATKAADAPKKSSFVGNLLGSLFTAALVVAGGVIYLTDSFKEVRSGEFEAVLEKAKAGWEAYPNKVVLGATGASLIALDSVATSLPLLNLLLPGLLQACGISVAGILLYRYLKEGKAPKEDISALDSLLPTQLPSLEAVKEKIIASGSGTVKIASSLKDTNIDTVKSDVTSKATAWWEGQENPVVVTAYGIGSLAGLFVANYVIHLPVLALVLPKVAELTGVCTLMAAVDRYNLRSTGTPSKDFDSAKSAVAASAQSLNLPGIK